MAASREKRRNLLEFLLPWVASMSSQSHLMSSSISGEKKKVKSNLQRCVNKETQKRISRVRVRNGQMGGSCHHFAFLSNFLRQLNHETSTFYFMPTIFFF